MRFRSLGRGDRTAAVRFVLMAPFPPGYKPPANALELPHVRRWLDGWGDEIGVGREENGELLGAVWARHVEPVLVRDEVTGEPLPEVIVGVDESERGAGIGRRLMAELLARAEAEGCPG